MSRSRRHRLFTVLLALCSLLFMQMALAGYSCPGTASKVQEQAAMAGMPCAESMSAVMDEAQPGLCHAHCQAVQQSSDPPQIQLPSLAPASGVAVDPPAPTRTLRSAPLPPLLARATAPPLSIRNCCFRI
jgi:hypothetical protein